MSLSSRIFIKNCTASDTARDKGLKIPEGINVFRNIPYDTKGHLLDVSVPSIYGTTEETTNDDEITKEKERKQRISKI